MIKVAIQNLGCSKNQIDGERIVHVLRAGGFECTEQFENAEVIIVNTCAFIREAQEEAIESILEMAQYKKRGRCTTLVVSGCFSERFRARVRTQFPEVDLWTGVHDWERMLRSHFALMSTDSFEREISEPVATQYLKIAEGCSHRCSFCAIPSIRGDYRSRTPESISGEARWLFDKGVRELILVAQDTSFYGRDIGISLETLLRMLLDTTRFPWIRMMYLHPAYITDSLLDLIASEHRLCPYFDIPFQHISDPILASMKRSPLSDGIYSLIERIRTRVPDAGIRTSFIVGYPGEKQTHFKELVSFVERARLDKIGAFPYSPEEGTAAFSLRGRPRNETVQRRIEELMLVQREISRERLESKIGSTLEVIIDKVAEDQDFNFEARTRIDAPEIDGKVLIAQGSFDPGAITSVKISNAGDYDLYA